MQDCYVFQINSDSIAFFYRKQFLKEANMKESLMRYVTFHFNFNWNFNSDFSWNFKFFFIEIQARLVYRNSKIKLTYLNMQYVIFSKTLYSYN